MDKSRDDLSIGIKYLLYYYGGGKPYYFLLVLKKFAKNESNSF